MRRPCDVMDVETNDLVRTKIIIDYTVNSHEKISIVVFVIMYVYIFLIIDLEVYVQLKSKTNREKDSTRFLTPG